MKRKTHLLIASSVLLLFLAAPALSEKAKIPAASDPVPQVDKSKPFVTPTAPGQVEAKRPQSSAAPNYDLSWLSINGGGASYGTSASYRLGYSVGQSVAGEGNSASYNLGIGFWYGASPLCLAIPGDVNGAGGITLTDIIYLVNYYFDKDRPATSCVGSDPGNCWEPVPLCRGEINGIAGITLTDIIYLVNYYFDKDRPATACLGSSPGNCWTPVASGTCCLPVP